MKRNTQHFETHNHHHHHSYTDIQKYRRNYENIKNFQNLRKKYQFLYQQPIAAEVAIQQSIDLYMIHKIEIYPHYTYPTLTLNGAQHQHQPQQQHKSQQDSADDCHPALLAIANVNMPREILNLDSDNMPLSPLPPYRTVSHYGFNYPSTYTQAVSQHPACSITSVDLQRQKVIAFIKRLNLEAQASGDNHLDAAVKLPMKTGKEDHIYENTKKLENAESFISVKEIQLNNLAKERKISTCSQTKSHDHHHQTQGDLLSEQFSSQLSISGTYPAATHSHTGDPDHFTTDSGDNCSNFDIHSRKNPSQNPYSSYVHRNFVPHISTDTDNSNDLPEDHDPHKPECEQQPSAKRKIHYSSSQSLRSDNNSHVTLTLNSLKRRASSLSDRKEKSSSRSRSKAASQLMSTKTSFGGRVADDHSSYDSNASTAIEIHINVNIRNSDCVKNLQNNEQAFKTKLEKVIDNEINLITQELETQEIANDTADRHDSPTFCLNPTHRCLSAPDAIGLYAARDPACIEADRQFPYDDILQSAASTPLPPSLHDKTNLHNLRYRHTLAMLEHELEMLLNSIIRSMCDCKTRISEISEDIRTATLHVGSLCTGPAKDKRPQLSHGAVSGRQQ